MDIYAARCRIFQGAGGCTTPTIRVLERIPSCVKGADEAYKTARTEFWRFWRLIRSVYSHEFLTDHRVGACIRKQASSRPEKGTRGRAGRPAAAWLFSVSPLPAQYDQEGLADDEKILPQRPILDVIEIELKHTFGIQLGPPTDLPRAG
jgi:hypothetical protein